MTRWFVLGLFIVPFFAYKIFAAHIPAPTGYVNDFAGVLSSSEKQSLEETLTAYKESTRIPKKYLHRLLRQGFSV